MVGERKKAVSKQGGEERKKLTKKQLELLYAVFRFRFVTVHELADFLGQAGHPRGAWQRLELLVGLGYLAKRYDGTYKIHGRPAEYYLTILSIPLLRSTFPEISVLELRQLYKRADASARFVARSLALFLMYNQLVRLHGEAAGIVMKPALNISAYEYLPRPLPDAFMTLSSKASGQRYYFVEYFDTDVSIGIHGRKVSGYMEYCESGEWDETGLPFPAVLIVCQSVGLVKQAEKRVRYLERQMDSGIVFRVIGLEALKSLESNRKRAWLDPIEKLAVTL